MWQVIRAVTQVRSALLRNCGQGKLCKLLLAALVLRAAVSWQVRLPYMLQYVYTNYYMSLYIALYLSSYKTWYMSLLYMALYMSLYMSFTC